MSLARVGCTALTDLSEPGWNETPFGPDTPAEELVCWSIERFRGWRTLFTTSFGMEGCALVDMYARRTGELEVTYLDTGFFFPETYALIERMRERYPHVVFVDRGAALSPAEQARRYGAELWKSDPDLCCRLRKVEPLRAAAAQADVWITALRRTQSATRAATELVEWDERFELLKLNPLAYWERSEVWDYVRRHGVPYNPLHEQGYPSIGCTHCTRQVAGVGVAEYTRLGRWSGTDKTECGLHFAAK